MTNVRNIEDWSDAELDTLDERYRKRNVAEGGPYTLAEVLLEKKRRSPNPFGVRETAVKIIELASLADDGLTTYGDLWSAFRPDEPWVGHRTLTVVSNALDRVVHYCVTNGLPILTPLVVQAADRKLSEAAITNMYNECRRLGVNVGPDPDAFISRQQELSRKMQIPSLPSA